MTKVASVAGLVLVVSCAVADTGYAQSPEKGSSERGSAAARASSSDPFEPAGARVDLKVRRLRIAGWSFLAGSAGTLACLFILPEIRGISGSDDESSRYLLTDVSLGVSTAGLLTIGGALLLRARLVEKRHKRSHQASVSVGFTGTGARLQVRF